MRYLSYKYVMCEAPSGKLVANTQKEKMKEKKLRIVFIDDGIEYDSSKNDFTNPIHIGFSNLIHAQLNSYIHDINEHDGFVFAEFSNNMPLNYTVKNIPDELITHIDLRQ